MTRIVLTISFLAVAFSANAQTPQQPSPQDRAMLMLYQREIQAHAADLAVALKLQEQLVATNKELDDLKKPPAPKSEAK